jgi:DNA processing protein
METDAMTAERERVDRLRLIRTENVGPITFRHLMEKFGSATAALDALPGLARRGGRGRALKLCPRDAAILEIEDNARAGAELVILGDDAYPAPLTAVEDAPPVFSVIGNPHLMKRRTVGMVGARNASANARSFTRAMAREIGGAGHVIVSGLARGIDAAAHAGSLETGTIAVVAGGVDSVYPPENADLYAQIAAEGLIIGEMRIGTKPQARHFPSRNRIIAGLSLGLVVIEASKNSGSLITARCALEQGREVFAVPGSPLDPRAAGTNQLLRDGANWAESAEDVIAGLRETRMEEAPSDDYRAPPTPFKPAEVTLKQRDAVLEMLGPSAVPVDEFIRECQLSPSIVITILSEAELAGQVERHPGNRVSRRIR